MVDTIKYNEWIEIAKKDLNFTEEIIQFIEEVIKCA